jgi:hypothetical protein
MDTHLEFSKAQYRELLFTIGMTIYLLELLTDLGGQTKYVASLKRMKALRDMVYRRAEDFGIYDWSEEESDGTFELSDTALERVGNVAHDVEEFFAYEHLSNVLAWRDFEREHTKKEIEEMGRENNGYFGVPLYDYEERYWNEFDAYGFNRLEIVIPDDKDITKKHS